MEKISDILSKKCKVNLTAVAKTENIDVKTLISRINRGTVVITNNIKRKMKTPSAVGEGMSTKVNANIGTSTDCSSIEKEREKLAAVVAAKADAVMDLSCGGNLNKIRAMVIKESPIPVGTVPVYQAIVETSRRGLPVHKMDPETLFSALERHASDGVDFMTVHCGVTLSTVKRLRKHKRICGIVSRGGAFLAGWMLANNKENPLYQNFERVLEIAKKYNVTLSLGDGLRPGALADADDNAQLSELHILAGMVTAARKEGVSVIVEGPGHMQLDKIVPHVKLQKRLTHNAPYYLLGPLVTDIAPGYDHITAAIGGTVAAAAGADFICYVTPAEHLRLPDIQDVHNGIIAARIAGHAGDIAKGLKPAFEWDKKFSKARKNLDWATQERLAIDPRKVHEERSKSVPKDKEVCTMCGTFCAMREISKYGI
ncbi:MAG: phosphomethylpyrimidine synthase ThiC [Elusimicrobiota bacterium]